MWLNYNEVKRINTVGHALPEEMAKAIHELVMHLSYNGDDEDNFSQNNLHLKMHGQSPHQHIAIKDNKTAELIKDVWDAGVKDIGSGYSMGVKRGSSLLFQLQSGDLSMNDFERLIKKATE